MHCYSIQYRKKNSDRNYLSYFLKLMPIRHSSYLISNNKLALLTQLMDIQSSNLTSLNLLRIPFAQKSLIFHTYNYPSQYVNSVVFATAELHIIKSNKTQRFPNCSPETEQSDDYPKISSPSREKPPISNRIVS